MSGVGGVSFETSHRSPSGQKTLSQDWGGNRPENQLNPEQRRTRWRPTSNKGRNQDKKQKMCIFEKHQPCTRKCIVVIPPLLITITLVLSCRKCDDGEQFKYFTQNWCPLLNHLHMASDSKQALWTLRLPKHHFTFFWISNLLHCYGVSGKGFYLLWEVLLNALRWSLQAGQNALNLLPLAGVVVIYYNKSGNGQKLWLL